MKGFFFIFLFSIMAGLSKAQSLKGTSWLLKNIDNIEAGKSQVMGDNIKLSLLFDSDSIYSGYGCNHYTGKYSTGEGKKLTMAQADAITGPSCLGLGNLEKQVLKLYLKTNRYRIDGDQLFIFTSDDYRLIFKKQ